jgi:outer membrane lipoprotein SlyB
MKLPIRSLAAAASALALVMLTACVAPQPVYETARYPYDPARSQPAAPVEYGRIADIEVVQSQSAGAPASGAGAMIGGVIGSLLGNQVGGGGGRVAAGALGMLGGVLLGSSIEANNNAPRVYHTYRMAVQTDNGGYRVFDVPSPGELQVGDRVVINNGPISRY